MSFTTSSESARRSGKSGVMSDRTSGVETCAREQRGIQTRQVVIVRGLFRRRLVSRPLQLPLHLHPLGQFHQLRNVSAQRVAGSGLLVGARREAMASLMPAALLLSPAALAAMIAPDHARSGERSTLISGRTNSGGRQIRIHQPAGKTAHRIRERLKGTTQRAGIIAKGIPGRIAETVKRIRGERGALHEMSCLPKSELEDPQRGRNNSSDRRARPTHENAFRWSASGARRLPSPGRAPGNSRRRSAGAGARESWPPPKFSEPNALRSKQPSKEAFGSGWRLATGNPPRTSRRKSRLKRS